MQKLHRWTWGGSFFLGGGGTLKDNGAGEETSALVFA
jgi:hypothetical protein